MELTDQAYRILTTAGFDQEFFKNLASSSTQKEAYEKSLGFLPMGAVPLGSYR